jgi:hypothetical protein
MPEAQGESEAWFFDCRVPQKHFVFRDSEAVFEPFSRSTFGRRGAYRGDDTKVRKLSGSRSYGDARALSNSSWNMIFKVLEGGEGDNLQKSTASRSKSNNQVDAFRLGATTRCPPRCVPLAQSARIHGQRLKLSKFGSLEPDNSDTFVSSPRL